MKIAFLGDSITYGYSLQNPSEKYSTLVCNETGNEEINLGICGTLMARAGMNRLDDRRSFVERVEQMQGADYGVIFGGTNDYFWSDNVIEIPQSGLNDGEDELSYFRPATEYVFSKALEIFGSDKLLIVLVYPHHGYGNFRHGANHNDARWHDTDAPNYLGNCLEDYCDVMRETAEKYGIKVLDLFRMCNSHTAGFDWQSLTTDGCHPNTAGHRWIADNVKKAIFE